MKRKTIWTLLLVGCIMLICYKIQQDYKIKNDKAFGLYTNQFNKLRYQNLFFDLSRFNYSGKCGEVFQYEPNNEKDLILYYVTFHGEESWLRIRDDTLKILEMSYAVMKNCHRILLLHSEEPTDYFVKEISRFGIEVIKENFINIEVVSSNQLKFEINQN